MRSIFRNRNLYVVNFALLATHEIDSAYWEEWNLFRLPGGIQLFLVLNLILFLAAGLGLVLVANQKKTGLYFSLTMAAAGLFAGAIHSYFLLTGHPEFNTPFSLGLLGLIIMVSILQGTKAINALQGHHFHRHESIQQTPVSSSR